MNRETKVSVIIPTYQEGKYIENLLSRLADINYPLDIIVVDGGSKDETIYAARHFTDKVYQINQRGISKAKNYGASHAEGEVIIFLDADITPPPNFVEKVLKVFNDSRAVGATCNIMPLQPRASEQAFFRFYNLLLRLCSLFKPHSRGEFLAVKKEEFLKINGFDENLPCLEDHDLVFRISKLGRFIFIADLTVYETMRRIRKLGLIKVLNTWITDYISLTIFGRTVSKAWRPVR